MIERMARQGLAADRIGSRKRMASKTGPILAVIDCATEDAEVVAEAAWLARTTRTQVLLMHVGRAIVATPWRGVGADSDSSQQQIGHEQRVMSELVQMAERLRAAGVDAMVDDVYFGDAAAEVAYAASKSAVSVVVALTRPAAWLPWRSRDARLSRLLRVPLVLVHPGAPTRGEAEQSFDLTPDERLLSATPAVAATPLAQHRLTNRAA
jgi:hypothetical protein